MHAEANVIHSPVTLRRSVSAGGQFWTYKGIRSILQKLGLISCSPHVTNEELPSHLPDILDALQLLVKEKPELFHHPDNPESLETVTGEISFLIRSLKQQLAQNADI